MSRLVDYFCIFGFDFNSISNGEVEGKGKLLQRFPKTDWPDSAFTDNLDMFCQPCGWFLSNSSSPPTYYVAVTTDSFGQRRYAACLNFYEPVPENFRGSAGIVISRVSRSSTTCESNVLTSNELDNCSTAEEMINTTVSPVTDDPDLIRPADLYSPKSLVLLSQHDYPEVLHDCLSVVYASYVDGSQTPLEELVGNILGRVTVMLPGSMGATRFSIGAGTHQIIRAPEFATVPVTGSCVTMLFRQIGIHNVLVLVSALLTDCRIVVYSRSYSRITSACRALTALLYPFEYSCHVYVPILPRGALHCIEAFVPFLYGMHYSLKCEVEDICQYQSQFEQHIAVDLDLGCIELPKNNAQAVTVISEPYYSRIVESLIKILNHELVSADYAFPSPEAPSPLNQCGYDPCWLDKQLRAVFVRMFADLLTGYRTCLLLTRIHPQPVMHFQRAFFLNHRNFQEDDFMQRLTGDNLIFHHFCQERGPPFRSTDIFDDVYESLGSKMGRERRDPNLVAEHINQLAQRFDKNENPQHTPFTQVVLKPTAGAEKRLHRRPFPILDHGLVQNCLQEGLKGESSRISVGHSPSKNIMMASQRRKEAEIVPVGPRLDIHAQQAISQCRMKDRQKLEVLENCVRYIFDNKISDAKKIMRAVKRDLKSRSSRLRLMELLNEYRVAGRAQLEDLQFDMVIELLAESLRHDGQNDEAEIAAMALPLVVHLCRRLNTGVMLFAYMTEEVQDCLAWQSDQFWLWAFSTDVQRQIRNSCISQYGTQMLSVGGNVPAAAGATVQVDEASSAAALIDSLSALDVAARMMALWPKLSESERKTLINNEDDYIQMTMNDFMLKLVYLRVPLDRRKRLGQESAADIRGTTAAALEASSTGSQITSVADNVSQNESGFNEELAAIEVFQTDLEQWINRFFIDKVCDNNNVPEERKKHLRDKVRDLIQGHYEIVECVWREYRLIPKMKKIKILEPILLDNVGEVLLSRGLRAYLLPIITERVEMHRDFMEEELRNQPAFVRENEEAHDPDLLPAEGALFLTNYRVIFKGIPGDILQSDRTLVKAFPLAALLKVKSHKRLFVKMPESTIKAENGLELRATTFEAMRIAFDDEVSLRQIEEFRAFLMTLRWPDELRKTFAFRWDPTTEEGETLAAAKKKVDKHSSLKRMAKNTLSKTAHRVVKVMRASDDKKVHHKPSKLGVSSPRHSRILSESESGMDFARLSGVDEERVWTLTSDSRQALVPKDAAYLRELSERAGYKDLTRLNLGTFQGTLSSQAIGRGGGPEGGIRLSLANSEGQLAATYPAMLVLPTGMADERLERVARAHRQGRLPCIVWRHARTRALLLRASAFSNKAGVMDALKTTQPSTAHEPSIGDELARYINAVVASSPACTSVGQQVLTVEKLLSETAEDELMLVTPVGKRRGPLDKMVHTIRGTSGGKGIVKKFYHVSSPVSRRKAVVASVCVEAVADVEALGRRNSSKMRSSGVVLREPSSSNTMTSNGAGYNFQGRNAGGGGVEQSVNDIGASNLASSHCVADNDSAVDSVGSTPGLRFVEDDSVSLTDSASVSTSHYYGLPRVPLYIIGESGQSNKVKHPNVEFVAVDVDGKTRNQVKDAFRRLLKLCLGCSNVGNGTTATANSGSSRGGGLLKQAEECGWLPLVSRCLVLAGLCVDLLDVVGSSVLIALEEGWDMTTIISCMTQILLDPHYRTFLGFRALIEKEWMSFGHKFDKRGGQTSHHNQASGFSPTYMFLLFLDCVHQIQRQFPLTFEFNIFYLEFLAYHLVSARFGNFLGDVESLHIEALARGASDVWEYIEQQNSRQPTFFNLLFAGEAESPIANDCSTADTALDFRVLRPCSKLPALVLWSYFLHEDTAYGPAYDIELCKQERAAQLEEAQLKQEPLWHDGYNLSTPVMLSELASLLVSLTKIYHSRTVLGAVIPNSPSRLSAISYPLASLNLPAQCTCYNVWRAVRSTFALSLRQLPTQLLADRARQREMHKRATLEFLMQCHLQPHSSNAVATHGTNNYAGTGNTIGGSLDQEGGGGNTNDRHTGRGRPAEEEWSLFTRSHRFEPQRHITAPTPCALCRRTVWPFGGVTVVCSDCGYLCHDKCAPQVPQNCTACRPAFSTIYTSTQVAADSAQPIVATTSSTCDTLDLLSADTIWSANHSSAMVSSSSSNTITRAMGMPVSTSNLVTTSSRSPTARSSPPVPMSLNSYGVNNNTEQRCHSGYLFKQGKYFRQWKQRWFLLDPLQNQLRQADSEQDQVNRGEIPLQEVRAVDLARFVSGAPRGREETCFYLETHSRKFYFAALSKDAAREWVERIRHLISQ